MKNSDTLTRKYLWGAYKTEAKISRSSKSQNKIITQLVNEFQDRSRSEIQKWRDAIQAAENPENPRWNMLQDIISNLLTDGHVMANIQIRKAAVTSNKFLIQDGDGNENIEATKLFQQEWMYKLIDKLLDSLFRGYAVLELTNTDFFEFTEIPHRNIAPQLHRVYFSTSGDEYVTYNDPSFSQHIIELQSNNILGIINDIVPQLIWKRNAQQTWADFSEKFGIPLVTAETLETDSKKLDSIQDMLSELGQSASAVLPEGTKITIHDATTKGDPHNIFSEQIATTNAEISKRIVGGTMISDSGSSRSQSEVHERTLDTKIAEADRKMIEFAINNKVIPLLANWGLKVNETDKFVFDRSESLTLSEHWKIVKEAMNFYDVDQTWLSKTFNIPIIQKKDVPTSQKKGLSANFQ